MNCNGFLFVSHHARERLREIAGGHPLQLFTDTYIRVKIMVKRRRHS